MAHLLFLSHAGADTERALRLAAAIEASPEARDAGLKVWVDKRSDGDHRLHAGTPWQDQLERAIAADSTSFGLLLTREGARNWVRLEVRVALDRVIAEQRHGGTYPFVPIIADDPGDLAHLPPFAQQYQGVRLTEDGSGLADLVRVAARLDAAQSVRLVAQPFMGLEAFEAKDAALFFGRRKETQDLVDRLRTTNLVLVTGDSGSGKSSLVKAGLIPAFREGALADPMRPRPEPGQWHVVEMRPGTDPFEGLVEGAQRAATIAGIAPEMILALGTAIRSRDPGSIRDALRLSGPSDAFLLLVVDQFEELWTLTADDTRRRDFLAALLALVPEGELARRAVGTMRRDYYHLHTDDDRLRDRLAANGNAGRFLLGAMALESLREIVEKPLLLAGESEARAAALADEVVKDVAGEPGNLALVEMALHESWERRHESGGDLALAYQRLDRLEGALARAAEEVFWNPNGDLRKLAEIERPVAEALFMRLVRAGDGAGVTRRPVAFTELAEQSQSVARKLAMRESQRLLVLREPDDSDRGADAITVELAHEQQWPDYRFWLWGTGTSRHETDLSRATDKRTLDRLIDAATIWLSHGRQKEDLARGGALADFSSLHSKPSRAPWLSPLEKALVVESQLAAARRRQTLWVGLAATLMLLLASLAIWQWRDAAAAKVEARGQQVAAEANARLADAQLAEAKRINSQRLASLSAQATASGDAVTGILLALQALPDQADRPGPRIVENLWPALRQALAEQRETLVLRGHESWISSAAFSPDGKQIVTGSRDQTVRIWRADGSGQPVVLRGHEDAVNSVAFSPDGTRIVTGSDDQTVRVWRSDGIGEPAVLRGHTDSVHSVAFSPDGKQIVTGSRDGTARTWRPDGTDKSSMILRGHSGAVYSVAFSPDGTRIVTGSDDQTVRVWRSDGIGEPVVLRIGDGTVSSVAFSPDGTRIVTGSQTQARVARADGIGEPVALRGHESEVKSVAFSPDGKQIVTASRDGTARIWRADGSAQSVVLHGHEDAVTTVAFSPDGTRIVTGSNDHTVRLWLTHSRGEPMVLRGHDDQVNSVACSSNGIRIATGSQDGTARIWRTDASGEVLILRGHEDAVNAVAFSPDGTRVVSGSWDSTARVWEIDGSQRPLVLRGHEDAVNSVAFSRDGTQILTGSSDGTARVWRADGAGESLILLGHEMGVSSVAFGPDGKQIFTAAGYELRVWQNNGSDDPLVLPEHRYPVATSPNGTWIVTGSAEGARIWPNDGGGEPLVLRGHDGSVSSISVSPDGTRIVTGGDQTARVWRADGNGDPVVLRGHDDSVTSVAFCSDGARIVTGSHDWSARVWALAGTLEQLAAYARSLKLPRQLTEVQKRQYFIVDDW